MRRNKPTKLKTDAGQEKKGEINWYLRGHILLQHLRKGEHGKMNKVKLKNVCLRGQVLLQHLVPGRTLQQILRFREQTDAQLFHLFFIIDHPHPHL